LSHARLGSPPVIVADKIIIGGAVNDNYSTQEQSGVIRAFDARTGALLWNWDSGNPDQTAPLPAGQTYTTNSPNSWSISSADEALGMVYIPLGNQTPDQLGMGRSANVERFSSSMVALDINTGQLKWVQQFVHHDLWDMDVPAQPVLFDLTKADGSVIPALVASTKQGDLYVLDRRTGAAIIPAARIEKPVTSFLVANILYPYRYWLEARLLGFTVTFCDLVTSLLPSIEISNRQSSDCCYARGQ